MMINNIRTLSATILVVTTASIVGMFIVKLALVANLALSSMVPSLIFAEFIFLFLGIGFSIFSFSEYTSPKPSFIIFVFLLFFSCAVLTGMVFGIIMELQGIGNHEVGFVVSVAITLLTVGLLFLLMQKTVLQVFIAKWMPANQAE